MSHGAGLPVARRWLRRLAPAALLAAGACATRGDVRLLRQDLLVMRAEATRADSSRRAQIEQVRRELDALDVVQDSLRGIASRLTRFQGESRDRLFAIDQQLIQVQELTGQSQRRLTELRASLEERQPAAGPDSAAPGPNQLFQLALDQLRRGSAGAARGAFEDLLRQNPSAELAADAQYYIGESWAAEGDTAQAVAAYQAVVAKYPRSPRAATALYKHGVVLQVQGKRAEARTMLNRVIAQFPRSDEAALARERLQAIR